MIEPPYLGQVTDQADERVRHRDAGVAFEALILGQMLQGVMPEGHAAGTAAKQALARELAGSSPFGIARMLEAKAK